MAAETFTLLAALSGGVVIYHVLSGLQDGLSQASYENNLNYAYEINLDCGKLSRPQYSSAIADSCAAINAAIRKSSPSLLERDSGYWQRSNNNVVSQLKAIVDRRPPKENLTSAIDKEEIGVAIKSLHFDEQYTPQSISSSWDHEFWEVLFTALVVIGTATIKFYVALIRRVPERMQALAKYITSFAF